MTDIITVTLFIKVGEGYDKLICIFGGSRRRTSHKKTMDALVKVADEIVVVDSGSTDKTESIVREYTDKFYYNKFISIGHQVKVAEELCSNKWVLRLDADEELSDELIKEILDIKENPDCDGYFLRIGEVFPGYSKPNRWVKHYKLIRLYNREKMAMSGKHGHDDVDFICKSPKRVC